MKNVALFLLVILLVLIGGCIFLEPYQHHAIHARLYATDCIGSLGQHRSYPVLSGEAR